MIKMLILLIALQSAPVEGPISDMIGRRVDKLAARVEAWKAETEQAQQSRFAEMMQSIADARQERKTILEAIRELRGEREGIFAEIAEFRKEREGIIGRLSDIRNRFDLVEKKWTPLQNLVDRLIGLVWKVIWLCVLLLVVFIVVSSGLLWAYSSMKAKLMKLSFSTAK